MKNETEDKKVKLLTKIEMADYLGVTVRTLEHYMSQGEIEFLRLGTRTVRFDLETVMARLKGGV